MTDFFRQIIPVDVLPLYLLYVNNQRQYIFSMYIYIYITIPSFTLHSSLVYIVLLYSYMKYSTTMPYIIWWNCFVSITINILFDDITHVPVYTYWNN